MNRRFRPHRIPLLALVGLLAGLALPQPAKAQAGPVVTDIVPDIDPGRDLGTTVRTAGSGHIIEGGTLAGNNLFHSFASFSLAQAEAAFWVQNSGDPAATQNVISRVTGGGASFISGTLVSTDIPNADFWFINPAGIVFGNGAQINVPAAAHFSTASNLQFAGGAAFQIATPDGSTLSVAAPEAFGFLGGEAGILLDGTGPIATPEALTLTALDVRIADTLVQSGELVLAAVGDAGARVFLNGSADRPLAGIVELSGARVETFGAPPGQDSLAINAGSVLFDASLARVITFGEDSGGTLRITAGALELANTSSLATFSNSGASGDVGAITVNVTGRVALSGRSEINAGTQGAGRGGDVSVNADVVELGGASGIFAASFPDATGDAGNLSVTAQTRIALTGGSRIQGDAQGAGNGGAVVVRAPEIVASEARISALTFAAGDGGDLTVVATDRLTATIASFFASSLGSGGTGDIKILGGALTLSNSFVGAQPSMMGGDPTMRGSVGDITIAATGALAIGGGTITTETSGASDAGAIALSGDSVSLNFVRVTSASTGFFDEGVPGNAGPISIAAAGAVQLRGADIVTAAEEFCLESCIGANAAPITISGGRIGVTDSRLQTQVSGSGIAGSIFLNSAGAIDVSVSDFTSDAFGLEGAEGGAAGAISLVAADDIAVEFSRFTTDNFNGGALGGGVSGFIGFETGGSLTLNDNILNAQTFGAGPAGGISLRAATRVSVTGGTIASDTFGAGTAGSVFFSAPEVRLDSAAVTSRAFEQGNAGGIFVLAPVFDLAGGSSLAIDSRISGITGIIDISADAVTIDASAISANAANGSTAMLTDGFIRFSGGFDEDGLRPASSIVLRNGASISTDTTGPGDGGSIIIDSSRLELIDSTIRAESVDCATTDCFDDGSFGTIGPQGPGGPAGTIRIGADTVVIATTGASSTAGISSNTFTEGMAGNVFVNGLSGGPSSLTISGAGAEITSESAASGDAGSVSIAFDNITVENGARITTSTNAGATGRGGNIAIGAADTLLIANGGKIEADTVFVCPTLSCGDQGRGGTISIAAGTLNLVGGTSLDNLTYIRASAFGTADAGQIDIDVGGDLIATDIAFISSDAFGNGRSGGVSADVGGTLSLSRGAYFSSDVFGAGDAGNISISAGLLELLGSRITSDAVDFTGGNAGTITIAADNLDMFSARISSDTGTNSFGDAGDVSVSVAATARLDSASTISSNSQGGGEGGQVGIEAGQSLILSDFSEISADAAGAGRGGSVFAFAPLVSLSGVSSISADALGAGDSGDVEVRGTTISLDSSFISSDATGTGDGGSATVSASGALTLDEASFISTDVQSSGQGGSVSVDAGSLAIRNGSFISSSVLVFDDGTGGSGNAGNVTVGVAGLLELSGGSSIRSDTDFGTTGNSGTIGVTARDIRLSDSSLISSTTLGDGDAISVDLQASRSIALTSGSVITSSAAGEGDAGFVSVTAPRVELTGQSIISSDTGGNGDAQIVSIVVTDRLDLSEASQVRSNSRNPLASGVGGGVFLDGGVINLRSGSAILANAQGSGAAGFISIVADAANLTDATIASQSRLSEGGSLEMRLTGDLSLIRSHIVTNSEGPGAAGNIFLSARAAGLTGASTIASEVTRTSTNRSGAIGVTTSGALAIGEASSISTTAANDQNAGSIFIEAGNLAIAGIGPAPLGTNSRITSANTGTGRAGAIDILQTQPGLGSGILLSEGAEITTRADPRVGTAGTIEIDMAAGSVLRLEGRTANSLIDTSGSSQGEGGKVTIGGMGAPYAVILNGGSILALGQTDPNLLSISSDFLIRSADRENRIAIGQGEEVGLEFEDVSSGTVSNALEVLDASRVLSGACPASRASGQFSQFTRPLIGPYAVTPAQSSPSGQPIAAAPGLPRLCR